MKTRLKYTMEYYRNFYAITILVIAIMITSCSVLTTPVNQPTRTEYKKNLQEIKFDREQLIMGQILYVPIYSHIYHQDNLKNEINLFATLSIRNIDIKNPIIISSVNYYNGDGKLIRQEIDHPVALNPLASTEFFVSTDDTSGGIGANFIVKWASLTKVAEPIVEAVMVSTTSSQGISFISPARVIERLDFKTKNNITD